MKKPRKAVGKDKTGKEFEKLLEAIFTGYATRGIARIEKVDPPVRMLPGKTIFLKNPWLDYAGTWTEIGGRMLILEAKYTDDERLEIGVGGITPRQQEELEKWHRYGAACAILWGHHGEVKVITAATFVAALQMGVKSFQWRQTPATPKGEGWIVFDVLGAIAARL